MKESPAFGSRFIKIGLGLYVVAACLVVAGCAGAPVESVLRERATLCLHRGMRFPANAAVRAEAMEAAGEVLGLPAASLLREGLRDEQAGVRFAACMSLGKIADLQSASAVRPLANDPDPRVRIGAFYALERMGDFTYRRVWTEIMQNDPAAEVRRNAVMTLGLLGNVKAKPLLKRLMVEDPDDGVRLQAIEAMALLGDADAEGRFIRDAFGGMGYRQPFALLVLGRAKSPDVINILGNRLYNAPYIEAKLAAARGLAMHGRRDGFNLAMQSLDWASPKPNLGDDPPANQIMRVRTMAAMALGEMRDNRALPALSRCMEAADDPRIQLAAARAIMMILNYSQLPEADTTSVPSRVRVAVPQK